MKTCPRHGITFEVITPLFFQLPTGQFAGYRGCDECKREYERLVFKLKVGEANLPPRFAGKNFESFMVSGVSQRTALSVTRDYAERFKEHRAAGRCLVETGKMGTGKTFLASIIGATLLRSDRTVLYSTAAEIVRAIRDTWRKDSKKDESSVLRQFQEPDLLIVDEIGAQFGKNGEQIQLSEVIDLRYRESRPTIAISNYGINEMAQFIGERAVDRLKDNGGKLVIFNWESYRGQNGIDPVPIEELDARPVVLKDRMTASDIIEEQRAAGPSTPILDINKFVPIDRHS